MSVSIRLAGICLSLALGATCALAQVEVKSDAVIYFGSATTTSAPAMIDEQKVREATPEWQTIQAEGVRRGTARYMLLQGDMDRRIRAAARLAAAHASKDLVVRTGDITNDQGRPAVDLTSDVIAKL